MAPPSRRERLAVAALAAGAAVLALLIAWSVLGLVPHVTDSISYLFQGRILAAGHLYEPPPRVPALFANENVILTATRWCSKYPPGWPLLLAIGWRVHAPLVDDPAAAGAGGRRRVARGPAPLRPGNRPARGCRPRLLAVRAADGGRRDGARAGPLRRGVVPGDDRRGGGGPSAPPAARRRRAFPACGGHGRWRGRRQDPPPADRRGPAGWIRPAHPSAHRGRVARPGRGLVRDRAGPAAASLRTGLDGPRGRALHRRDGGVRRGGLRRAAGDRLRGLRAGALRPGGRRAGALVGGAAAQAPVVPRPAESIALGPSLGRPGAPRAAAPGAAPTRRRRGARGQRRLPRPRLLLLLLRRRPLLGPANGLREPGAALAARGPLAAHRGRLVREGPAAVRRAQAPGPPGDPGPPAARGPPGAPAASARRDAARAAPGRGRRRGLPAALLSPGPPAAAADGAPCGLVRDGVAGAAARRRPGRPGSRRAGVRRRQSLVLQRLLPRERPAPRDRPAGLRPRHPAAARGRPRRLPSPRGLAGPDRRGHPRSSLRPQRRKADPAHLAAAAAVVLIASFSFASLPRL